MKPSTRGRIGIYLPLNAVRSAAGPVNRRGSEKQAKQSSDHGSLTVQKVRWCESRVTVPRTCSASRRTRPNPCRLFSALASNPGPLSSTVIVAMPSLPAGASIVYRIVFANVTAAEAPCRRSVGIKFIATRFSEQNRRGTGIRLYLLAQMVHVRLQGMCLHLGIIPQIAL